MLQVINIQIMLYELGYYNSNVKKEITNDDFDGKMGPNFKRALTWFQQDNKIKVDGSYGPESDKTLQSVYNKFINSSMDWNDSVLVNFKKSEFLCKCCGVDKIKKQIVYHAQALRHYMNEPLNITSGYRCEKKNKSVGGSSTSKHKEGKAIDFYNKSLTNTLEKRKKLIQFYTSYFPNARQAYCNGYRILNGKITNPSVNTMGTSIHIDIN